MRKGLLPIAALGVWLAAMPAMADVLTVPEATRAPSIHQLPTKGTTMADVEKKYGEPATRRPTVGGGSPKQPPITRWDYPGFSVIFEKDRVVDGVIPGAPPRIVNRQGLKTVDVPVIAPSVSYTPVEAAPDAPAEMPAEPPAEEMPAEIMSDSSEAPAETTTEPGAPAEAPAESEPAAFQEMAPPATPSSESEEPKPLP